MQWKKNDFEISTDKTLLNKEIICQFLREQSYWATNRSQHQIIASIENSLCFGLYEQGVQIGFARVVTDSVTFAWLADVFIIQSHQGLGLGKWLIEVICNWDTLKNIATWLLFTNDAHTLYAKAGFVEFPYPERVMIKT